MISEPKSKQTSRSQTQQFVVLNHILFSNIATITTMLLSKEAKPYHPELVQLARKAFSKLVKSFEQFGGEESLSLPEENVLASAAPSPDDALLKEQLTFIYNISKDIDRLTGILTPETTEPPVRSPLVPAQ